MVADDEGFLDQQSGFVARRDQVLGLGRVHGERLFAEHMLAGFERLDRPRHMKVIGQRVVHHIELRVLDQRLIGAVRPRDAELCRQLFGRFRAPAGDRRELEPFALQQCRNDMFDDKARTAQYSPT